MQMIRGIPFPFPSLLRMLSRVSLSTHAESNLWPIAYNSHEITLLVIRRHFTLDQWIKLHCSSSAKTVTNPICDEWSLLFANLVTYLTSFARPESLWPKNAFWPSSYSAFETFSMATRMSAARQLLKALETLHNAGIAHNCELTPVTYSLTSLLPRFARRQGRISEHYNLQLVDI